MSHPRIIMQRDFGETCFVVEIVRGGFHSASSASSCKTRGSIDLVRAFGPVLFNIRESTARRSADYATEYREDNAVADLKGINFLVAARKIAR